MKTIVAVCVLLLAGCGIGKPPFSLQQEEGGLTVHVETLGEYPTSIGRIEVVEKETGDTVWKVLPSGKKFFQLHNFQLRPGVNRTDLDLFWGASRTVIPEGRQSFDLRPGVPYEVKVCGGEGLKRCADGTFRFR